MKTLLFISLLVIVLSQNLISDFYTEAGLCFAKSKSFYNEVNSALTQKSTDAIIDSLEKMSEKVPGLLRACGAEDEAQAYEEAYPPACTKILAKEAKIFVKIMKLYAEDQVKNEKQIMICKLKIMQTQQCSRHSTRHRSKRNALSLLSNTLWKPPIKENVLKVLTDSVYSSRSLTMT